VAASLGSERIGKPIKAFVLRGGKAEEAVITVGERP
jgi:S1-C subfamily serine protease